MTGDDRILQPRDGSLPPEFSGPRSGPRDPETCSLHSLRSENSFKTCSSEPQLNLVPRQVSDTYNDAASTDRAAQDRAASIRAFKQQYSDLNAIGNNGTVHQPPGSRYSNKPVR